MSKRKGGITASELLSQLEKDPNYQARIIEREQREKLFLEAEKHEQIDLIKDLEWVGVYVETIWALVNTSEPYPKAIPILLKHLKCPYKKRTREGIARALAVPDAAYAWEELLEMYKNNPETESNGFKWALACALSVYARKRMLYDESLAILRDRKHGKNRMPFLSVFTKSRKQEIRSQIEAFATDPDLEIEVNHHLKKWEKARKKKSTS